MRRTYYLFWILFLIPNLTAQASEISDQMKSFLKDAEMTKVKLREIGPLLVVEGEADIPIQLENLARITQSLRANGVAIESLVRLSPDTWMKIAERVEREIGSPEITARFIGARLVIEGTAMNDFEADRAVEIARTYLATIPPPYSVMSALDIPTRGYTAAGKNATDRRAASDPQVASGNAGPYNPIVILDLMRVMPRAKPTKKR